MFYRANFVREHGRVLVTFADCPGCVTEGDTPAEALEAAHEALAGWLEASLQIGNAPPRPKARTGVQVMVPVMLALVLQLRWHRVDRGLTQTAAAKLAEVSQQQIARIEDPDGNPTLGMIDRVAKSYGLVLRVALDQAPTPPKLEVQSARGKRARPATGKKKRAA